MGFLLLESEKYKNLEEAESDIDKFLETNENNALAWTIKGHIASDLDKNSLAVASYQKALDLDSLIVEAITGLGIIARKNKNYDKASELYHKAIKIDPEYAQAYSSLAAIYLLQKKFEQAAVLGLKGYNLEKEDPIISSNLALVYHYKNDTINRDKFYEISKANGYYNLEALEQIFNGELTIFD